MRVKIGNVWHDSKDQPIAVELTDADKVNIANMLPSCDTYAEYQIEQFSNSDACRVWMKEKASNV